MRSFSETLKPRLTERGSKAALARGVGVEPRTVSYWLRGDKQPAVETMERVAEYFGESPEQMYGDLWDHVHNVRPPRGPKVLSREEMAKQVAMLTEMVQGLTTDVEQQRTYLREIAQALKDVASGEVDSVELTFPFQDGEAAAEPVEVRVSKGPATRAEGTLDAAASEVATSLKRDAENARQRLQRRDEQSQQDPDERRRAGL